MPIDRFYLDALFVEGNHVILEGEEAHHLLLVTRAKENQRIELVNGQGQLANVTIASIKKGIAFLKILNVVTEEPKEKKVILAQALPRLNRLDTILEKGCELGVDAFWLFPGERSEKLSVNETRSKKILINAMKQCGRLDLPLLLVKPHFSKWEEKLSNAYFGDLNGVPFLGNVTLTDETVFFIGPEGGFTPNEVNVFKSKEVKGIKLHRHILRTDTAAICALAILNSCF